MASLIVNLPTGEQARIEIDESGSYFDQSKVLWDSRTDGPVPVNIELGKMQRVGGNLIKAATVLEAHANAVYQKNLPIEVPIACALEALVDAGLYDAIEAYFNARPMDEKIWFERATTVNKYNKFVQQVKVQFGWTDEQLDQLFIAAEQIRINSLNGN